MTLDPLLEGMSQSRSNSHTILTPFLSLTLFLPALLQYSLNLGAGDMLSDSFLHPWLSMDTNSNSSFVLSSLVTYKLQ